MNLSSFGDLAASDAGRANHFAFDRTFEDDLNSLQIGEETAKCFPDDLGTGTALTLDHTASFIFVAGDSSLAADNTRFHNFTLLIFDFINLLFNEV